MRGLSRSHLNIVIFVCLGAIIWINLTHNRQEEVVLEPLKLPALSDGGWQRWPNQEQVTVLLRAAGTTAGGSITLRSEQGLQHLHLPAQQWAPVLEQQLSTLATETPAVILISGPWQPADQQAMAALLIRDLRLQPLPASLTPWPLCLQQHMPGALWLGQFYGLNWQTLGALPETMSSSQPPQPPLRADWAIWRLDQSRQLRRAWQDEQSQIDIQADLTYHRLPDSTYQSLYLSLADAQKTDVTEVLDCLTPAQGASHE